MSADKHRIIHGEQALLPGHTHWMIKFQASSDAREIGAIENAYSLMVKDAGVVMPETHLFRTKKNRYFGTRRFDRYGNALIHLHSLSGMIHAGHRMPGADSS